MAILNDHPAFPTDGPTQGYCATPKFSVMPGYDPAEEWVYKASQAAKDAQIAASKLAYASEMAVRWKAREEKLEELKQAARDCEMALAEVIAKLCREPTAQLSSPEVA